MECDGVVTTSAGTTAAPECWPSVPSPWSVSVLTQIEGCPRCWALMNAKYPGLWGGHGYPRLLSPSALAGQVIHASIRLVGSALAQAGCTSAREPGATSVFRTLGGLTSVLHEAFARVLDREEDNPRVQPLLARLRADFARDVPLLRQQLQEQLRRLTLFPRPSASNKDGRYVGVLREGSYHEVRVRSSSLDVVGVIDLLIISPGHSTIWEFKTGGPSDHHIEQVRVYALLWAEDERNPTHEPPDDIVLSYQHDLHHVPPLSREDLTVLRGELAQRLRVAASAVMVNPPPARPTPTRCTTCDVRQLCPEYWSAIATWEVGVVPVWWLDVEVHVGRARGPRSWDAMLVRGQGVTSPTPVVLVHGATDGAHRVPSGVRVRLLGVRSSVVDGTTLVTMNAATQVFAAR